MAKTILIVDDEPHIRLLLEQTLDELEDFDVDVLTANDGGQALAAAREHLPDVMLLDVMMPVMNGFDVCQTLKADPATKGIQIFMLTAKGQETDRQSGLDAGADRFITKPFDPDDVLEDVAALLGIEL